MTKIRAAMLAATLALSGALQIVAANPVSAHGGHGGGGGMHMSSAHFSSFHSAPSFHSSPSFHSFSSFHSMPSFHSSPSFSSTPSFHQSSFTSPSSSFGSFGFGSHHSHTSMPDQQNLDSSFHGESSSGSMFGHHSHASDSNSPSGINNDTGMSHHGGFLFWGHHNNNISTPVTTLPGGGQGTLATPGGEHHHDGFLFWGHHHNGYNNQAYGDGAPNTVALGHHYHQSFNDINMYPLSSMQPPSTMTIQMASPRITQVTPIQSLSITKYFYSPPPQINYNRGYFGGYGSTYGGYGYFPTRGIASLLFRLMSLIGFGGSNYYNSGLSSNNFLGTWGPQSSLMTGTFDNANSTNFIDNYNSFNYTGGNVQPFANLLPDGTPYGDQDPQNLALQQPEQNGQYLTSQMSDANAQNALNGLYQPDPNALNGQYPSQQPDPNVDPNMGNSYGQNAGMQYSNQLSMNTPNNYLPPGLRGQVSDSATADAQNSVELKATALPLIPPVAFPQPQFDYHHIGALGSAFTHNIKLPADAYRAPEILGIIFTHQFWDAATQDSAPTEEQQPQMQPIVTGQNSN